jgi:hypothetical protein
MLSLFPKDEFHNNYRYSAYITNIEFACAEIWRIYRGRGDAENSIKALFIIIAFDLLLS